MKGQQVIGGLSCAEVLERLSRYLDGELDAAEVEALKEHVGGCSACERFGGRFAEAVSRLREGTPAAAVDPAVEARLRARLGLG